MPARFESGQGFVEPRRGLKNTATSWSAPLDKGAVPALKAEVVTTGLKSQLQGGGGRRWRRPTGLPGLARLVEQVRESGQSTRVVIEQYRQNASAQDADACPYLAWGIGFE